MRLSDMPETFWNVLTVDLDSFEDWRSWDAETLSSYVASRLAVTTGPDTDCLPEWLDRLATDGDLDTYILDGIVIYVGSHS